MPRERYFLARGVDRVALFLASGFGSGYSPIAPGTCGSLVAAIMVFALSQTQLPASTTLFVLLAVSTALCLILGRRVERILGKKDPGLFVMDEFAGFFLAIATLKAEWPGPSEILVAFVLFRIFDVAKPTPARQLQNLGGGRGIVLDDLAAGGYALLGVIVYRHLMENPL